MYFFIILSLVLCYMTQMQNILLISLVTPELMYLGYTLSGIGLLIVFLKKIPIKYGYELFSIGALLIWYTQWQPIFKDDSPIFFVFSLYFVFLATFIELNLQGQKITVDQITREKMNIIVTRSQFKPWTIMLGVLISVALYEHYLLYPVMMTLLMIRFALFRYLKQCDN